MSTTHAIGRRKTSVARVYVKPGKGEITINKRELSNYFSTGTLQYKVRQPLSMTDNLSNFDVTVNVEGGGIKGQAEAVRLGVARALVAVNAENKPALKKEGFMTRDSRMVERKKPGRRKARRRFQFSKR